MLTPAQGPGSGRGLARRRSRFPPRITCSAPGGRNAGSLPVPWASAPVRCAAPQLFWQRSKAAAEDALSLGDSEADLNAATAAGGRFVAIAPGSERRARMKESGAGAVFRRRLNYGCIQCRIRRNRDTDGLFSSMRCRCPSKLDPPS
jgi:hypothetical protein